MLFAVYLIKAMRAMLCYCRRKSIVRTCGQDISRAADLHGDERSSFYTARRSYILFQCQRANAELNNTTQLSTEKEGSGKLGVRR